MRKFIFWVSYVPLGIMYLFFIVIPAELFSDLEEFTNEMLQKYENWAFKH